MVCQVINGLHVPGIFIRCVAWAEAIAFFVMAFRLWRRPRRGGAMSKKDNIVKLRFYQGPHFSTELEDSEFYSVFRAQRQILAQKDARQTEALATDNGGSILAVHEKDVRRTYSYTPYGFRSLIHDKRDRLGFNGELQDYLTNYYMLGNGHRGLHQHVFLSPDELSPFGRGGINTYAYSTGDPINYIDPSGRFILLKALAASISTMAGAFSGLAAMFTGSRMAQITGGIAAGAGLAAAANITDRTANSYLVISASAAATSIYYNVKQVASNAQMTAASNARLKILRKLRSMAARTPALTGHSTLAHHAAIALPENSRHNANSMKPVAIWGTEVDDVLTLGPTNARAVIAARRASNPDALFEELKSMNTEGLSPKIAALIRET